MTLPDETVAWLELLREVQRVVDEREAGRLATAEVRVEAKAEDEIGRGLVELSDFVSDLFLREGRTIGMGHVDDHLATAEKTVGFEFTRTNSTGRIRHD